MCAEPGDTVVLIDENEPPSETDVKQSEEEERGSAGDAKQDGEAEQDESGAKDGVIDFQPEAHHERFRLEFVHQSIWHAAVVGDGILLGGGGGREAIFVDRTIHGYGFVGDAGSGEFLEARLNGPDGEPKAEEDCAVGERQLIIVRCGFGGHGGT